MKHWFVLFAATAAFTAFAPASQAQVAVEVPGVGVRIGEPPPPRREERIIEREVRGNDCRTVSVTETGPDGSTRTVTRRKCD
ncbi:MAG: hypothetical protein QOF14_2635 [Hyphomicrobiales bacterium]|jgi:hypothetical protein|nr:hypothetical protein [Hyphomicrobiales bacterium]MEA2877439.1 hypothetical protein [Hyphomicrobiales bacterium]